MYLRIVLLASLCIAGGVCTQDNNENKTIALVDIFQEVLTCGQFDRQNEQFCVNIAGRSPDHIRGLQESYALKPKQQKYKEYCLIPEYIKSYFINRHDVTPDVMSQLYEHIIGQGAGEAMEVTLHYAPYKPQSITLQDGTQIDPYTYACRCFNKYKKYDHVWRFQQRNKIIQLLAQNRHYFHTPCWVNNFF